MARAGALRYRLTTDGVLVAALEEGGTDRPGVPDATHSPGPRLMTWKHMLLGAVRNTVTGQRRNAKEMAAWLERLVTWYPPESLTGGSSTWYKRCKWCASVHGRPTFEPPPRAVAESKPLYRVHIDLMQVKPTGNGDERYVLT